MVPLLYFLNIWNQENEKYFKVFDFPEGLETFLRFWIFLYGQKCKERKKRKNISFFVNIFFFEIVKLITERQLITWTYFYQCVTSRGGRKENEILKQEYQLKKNTHQRFRSTGNFWNWRYFFSFRCCWCCFQESWGGMCFYSVRTFHLNRRTESPILRHYDAKYSNKIDLVWAKILTNCLSCIWCAQSCRMERDLALCWGNTLTKVMIRLWQTLFRDTQRKNGLKN